MKQKDDKGTSAAKKLARKKADKNERDNQRYQTTSNTPYDGANAIFQPMERAWKNPQNSKVTSNLPSVGVANRRDRGSELTVPQEYARESYAPGMSGGGRTFVRNINATPIDPEYIWKNDRDAAARKKDAAARKKYR